MVSLHHYNTTGERFRLRSRGLLFIYPMGTARFSGIKTAYMLIQTIIYLCEIFIHNTPSDVLDVIELQTPKHPNFQNYNKNKILVYM